MLWHHFHLEKNRLVTPPNTLRDEFVSILYRAEPFLYRKTQAQINCLCLFLSELTKQPGYVSPQVHLIENWKPIKQKLDDRDDLEFMPCLNEVEDVKLNMGNIQLEGIQGYGQLDWASLFAALAVSYVSKAAEVEEYQQGPDEETFMRPKLPKEDWFSILTECLVLAGQAIEIAESVEAKKKEASKRASSLAKARHDSLTGELKKVVLGRYQDHHTKRSNRDAARRVFSELLKEGLIELDRSGYQLSYGGEVVLQTDDPEKRFEIWIGHSKKKSK